MLKLHLTWRFWKIFSKTWLWKISMSPLCYNHILAILITLSIGLLLLYSNPHKKQAFDFFKRNSYTCLFNTLLWREIDNATSYFLTSCKNLKWTQNFHIDTFWNYLLLNLLFGGAKYQKGDEAEARGTDE